MFVGLARNVFSINAMTQFEKSRMQATYYGDKYPPDEASLKRIILAISGKDSEIRDSIAFSMITAKMQTSQSKKYWNYQVKNMVVLDRLIDEDLFLTDIAELKLQNVENFQPKEEKYIRKKLGEFVQLYFKYIKGKASLYRNKKSSMHVRKDKLKDHFITLGAIGTLKENELLSNFCTLAMDVIRTGSEGHLKYQLNQYVFLLILNTMLNVLSVQYAAFIGLVEHFFETELEVAQRCLEAFKAFLKSTSDLISMAEDYQFIPGFQISLYGLRNPKADAKLLYSMEEYIRIIQRRDRNPSIRLSVDYFNLRPEDFQMKRGSEIDLPLCLERIRASYKPSPTKVNKNKETQPDEDSDHGEVGDEKTANRPSIQFVKTFRAGYQGTVITGGSIEEIINDQLVADIKKDRPENVRGYNLQDEEEKDMLAHLSSSFKKLLVEEEEKNEVFYGRQNFYSGEFISDIKGQYEDVYKRQEREKGLFELKPLELVNNGYENQRRRVDELTNANDFDEDLFNNYKNWYSRDV